jgi:methyl-accepting chemotaxis protein
MGFFTGGRRRKLVVDRRFQYGTTILGIAYIVAIAVFITVPLLELMQQIDTLAEGQGEELAHFYKSQQRYTFASVALFFFGIMGAWTAFSLWRTHKVAGPLVKITRYVHQFATGNFDDHIVLRDKDQLRALASALNDMATSLGERDRTLRQEILGQIEAVRSSLYDTPGAERAIQTLDRLAEGVNHSFDTKWEAPDPELEPQEEPIRT